MEDNYSDEMMAWFYFWKLQALNRTDRETMVCNLIKAYESKFVTESKIRSILNIILNRKSNTNRVE